MTANQFSSRAFLSDNEEQLGAIGLFGQWTLVDPSDGEPMFDASLQIGDCFRTVTVPFRVSGQNATGPALHKLYLFRKALNMIEREIVAFEKARAK